MLHIIYLQNRKRKIKQRDKLSLKWNFKKYNRKAKMSLSKSLSTVTEKWDCHRKVRLSPLSRHFLRQLHFSATVSLFCNSLTFLWHCGQGLTVTVYWQSMTVSHLPPSSRYHEAWWGQSVVSLWLLTQKTPHRMTRQDERRVHRST